MDKLPFSHTLVEKRLIRPNQYALIFEHDEICIVNTTQDTVTNIVSALNNAYALGYQIQDSSDNSYTTKGKIIDPVFNFIVIEDFDDMGFPYTDMRMESNVGIKCGLNHLCPKDAKSFVDLMNQAVIFGMAHSRLSQVKNECSQLNM